MSHFLYASGALLLAGVVCRGAWRWLMSNTYSPRIKTHRPVSVSQSPLSLSSRECTHCIPSGTIKHGYWSVAEGVDLHYQSHGNGPIPVLVVHGGPSIPVMEPWKCLQTSALESKFTFYYYDQRGCGRSSRPIDRFASKSWSSKGQLFGALGLAQQIDDIERIRCVLAVDKLVIIGHSFGAFLSSLYASEYPQCVAQLVLIAPASTMRMPNNFDLFAAVERALAAKPTRQAEFITWKKRYMDFSQLFTRSEAELAKLNFEVGPFYFDALGIQPQQLMPEMPAEYCGGWSTFAMYLDMGMYHDFLPALQQITAHTLIIHGDKDLQPLEVAEEYAQNIQSEPRSAPAPKVVIERIKEATHFPQFETPQEFAQIVTKFLGEGSN